MFKEALYYRKEIDNIVRCTLCPHQCKISPGKAGTCKARKNIEGVLVAETYRIIASSSLDPIEKKPLYHFHPGGMIYSIGSFGCNLQCVFCQNHEISQNIPDNLANYRKTQPDEVVTRAKMHPNNIGVAFTYNEPTISYEFILETAKLSKGSGMKNVMVTNGYINPKPLTELLGYIDAFNVDLKAFNDSFYKKYTGSNLAPVLETLKSVRAKGKHLEVTFLVIPELNDDEKSAAEMFKWIAGELGSDTVLHLSRYYPSYRLNNPSTSPETLFRFYELATQNLNFVYIGNLSNSLYGRNTLCPKCSNMLVKREGYSSSLLGLTREGNCKSCGHNSKIVIY